MNKLIATLLLMGAACSIDAQPIKPVMPIPTREQLVWHEKEFYLFIHFGPNTFSDKEWGDGKESPEIFNPTKLDCDQWASIAKQAGAKGIILTAKHHDGFCLWPSKNSTHTVRESKWMDGKGDVVKALAAACRKAGIEMGVYLSPWDRNHPAYGTPQYNDVYIATMKELLTQYGKFFELWWDGANGEGPNGKKQVYDFKRFRDSAFSWQQQLIIFSDIGPGVRWCGNENGFIGNTNWNLLDTAGYLPGNGAPHPDTLNTGNVYGKHWIPAEADVSIRPGWFYHASEDNKVKSPQTLFNIFLRSVGNGGNLLLNVPPDRTGRFNAQDSLSLIEFGRLRKAAFNNNLLRTAKFSSKENPAQLKYLSDNNIHTGWQATQSANNVIECKWTKPVSINSLVLEEMIDYGQRVFSFSIESFDGVKYQPVYTGTTIGRKKIAVFPVQNSRQLRITIHQSKAPVVLRSISGYLLPVD